MGVNPRSAVVTGASSGIGAAVAHVLARRGCDLVLVGREKDRLAEVRGATGGTALVADLRFPEDVRRVADAAGSTDLLVNNAGSGWAGPLAEMSSQAAEDLIAANLTAPVQLTRLLLPVMTKRRRGHLVFVSSIAAVGVADEATYSATKSGLRAFASSVRAEAAPYGVGVTTILPGAVRTPFFESRGRPYDRTCPRPVAPETVAAALVDAVDRDRHEVFVPRWLAAAARVHGLMPATFHRLARRFG